MSHLTIHASNGATATVAWTHAGYDAVAWEGDTRASLIDDIDDARSLWSAAVWITDQLKYGNENDVGEVLARLFVVNDLRTTAKLLWSDKQLNRRQWQH